MSKQSKGAGSANLKKLPPELALSLLESAVAYCQASGLAVRVDTLPGAESAAGAALVVTVSGAAVEVVDGVTRLVPLPQAPAEPQAEAP